MHHEDFAMTTRPFIRLHRNLSIASALAATSLPLVAFAQNIMPPGTRQWIQLAANSIAACSCVDDKIGFVAAMPTPSPNYVRNPAGIALGQVLTATGASTATSMNVHYNTNYFDNIFLHNSFVDTYTIVGPPGTQGQPVAASVTMHATGMLRVVPAQNGIVIGTSALGVEVGTWSPETVSEQFRVTATAANTRIVFIPFANYGQTPQALPVNETIVAPFTPNVGEPFDVAFGLDLSGRNATIAATIAWTLPPGYTITSVLGYNSGPTPCDSVDFNGNTIFPEDQDIIDFFNVLAGAPCPTGTCNDVDFNNNTIFPEDQDIIDFLNTLAGATCP
jgi:hypothetical protein